MNNSIEYIEKDFGKILKKNAQEMRHNFLEEGTDCFRVYDRNLSTFPVTVDLYSHYAKVTDFGAEPLTDVLRAECLDICSRMLYLDKDNVIYSYRAKREQGQQHEKTEEKPVVLDVHEHGLTFKVDLTSHVDTGLFLDHAITRQFVQSRSQDADVLNLFSYTGSFSVYAAAGLAHTVTSVDMSATYSAWAEENLRANGFTGENYKCVCSDAKAFVIDAQNSGKKYDIIIFDPPAFSNSHKMDYDFDVARDWADWVKNLSALLKKTGILLFSTNLGSFSMDRRKIRGMVIKEVTSLMWAPGFVKGRNGTVRSWVMAFDDDSLSLDWSEPKKEAGKEHQQKSTDRGYRSERSSDRPRKSYGREGGEKKYGRNEWTGDRSRRDRSDRFDRSERSFDRPRREYSDRGERSERSERSFDRPRREYSDRGERSERSERSFDRPRREYSDRGERPERSERSFDRPRREYSDRGARSERSERSFDRPRREYSDRGERSERSERSFDRPRREYSDRGERSERSDRSFDRPRREYSDRRSPRGGAKPYGFDSFKSARSRNDSSDFFWNVEDLEKKDSNK